MKKLSVFFCILMMGLLCACGERVDEQQNVIEESSMQADGDTMDKEVYVLTFSATTIDGEKITSDCFNDSALTMINVWGTFCNPCLQEMPDLGALANEYDKSDFQIYGIITDVTEESKSEDIENAKRLIEDTQADYPHLLLNEELYINLVSASDSVPTTYFFNQQGELLGYLVGAQSKEGWKEIIDELLVETK